MNAFELLVRGFDSRLGRTFCRLSHSWIGWLSPLPSSFSHLLWGDKTKTSKKGSKVSKEFNTSCRWPTGIERDSLFKSSLWHQVHSFVSLVDVTRSSRSYTGSPMDTCASYSTVWSPLYPCLSLDFRIWVNVCDSEDYLFLGQNPSGPITVLFIGIFCSIFTLSERNTNLVKFDGTIVSWPWISDNVGTSSWPFFLSCAK